MNQFAKTRAKPRDQSKDFFLMQKIEFPEISFLTSPELELFMSNDSKRNEQHQSQATVRGTNEKPKTKTKQNMFPWKLYEMLKDSENENNGDIVGWQPDGLSFRICKQKDFVSTIMPRYFNHSNFRSFQRQLYHYNFERVPEGPFRGSYFHPQFTKHNGFKSLKSRKKLKSETKKRLQATGNNVHASLNDMIPDRMKDNNNNFPEFRSMPTNSFDLIDQKNHHGIVSDDVVVRGNNTQTIGPKFDDFDNRQIQSSSTSYYPNNNKRQHQPHESILGNLNVPPAHFWISPTQEELSEICCDGEPFSSSSTNNLQCGSMTSIRETVPPLHFKESIPDLEPTPIGKKKNNDLINDDDSSSDEMNNLLKSIFATDERNSTRRTDGSIVESGVHSSVFADQQRQQSLLINDLSLCLEPTPLPEEPFLLRNKSNNKKNDEKTKKESC